VSLFDEWIEKAEADYKSAVALQRRRKEPPRIHDLEDLLNLCALYDATLSTRLPLVHVLNPYGVLIRYPGMTATVVEAQEAVHAMRRLRTILRRTLEL
jgi:hypothetical protein